MTRHEADEQRVVIELGALQLSKLERRRARGHWCGLRVERCAELFFDEVYELGVEVQEYLAAEDLVTRKAAAQRIREEAADCANFLAFLIDNVADDV